MTLSKTVSTIKVGASETLTATVAPTDADDKTVTFSSSNEAIATVTPKLGKVTAIAEGTAVITVTTVNGKTAACNYTVEGA